MWRRHLVVVLAMSTSGWRSDITAASRGLAVPAGQLDVVHVRGSHAHLLRTQLPAADSPAKGNRRRQPATAAAAAECSRSAPWAGAPAIVTIAETSQKGTASANKRPCCLPGVGNPC